MGKFDNNISCRTDLAMESVETGRLTSGVSTQKSTKENILIIRIKVETKKAALALQKPVGEYVTFNVSNFKSPNIDIIGEAKVIAKTMEEFFPKNENGVLIVGLGNSDITPDALGPKAISYCFATRHISGELKKSIGMEQLRSVCAIATGVLGKTGIETAEIVSSLVKSLAPSFVVVIDSLAAKSVTRLGNTIQMSNVGISPGSGVQNARKELSFATLGVPVIAIGVPMVVDMATIAPEADADADPAQTSENEVQTMMVTPREIDLCIEHAAKMVAYSVNKALQPALSMEEIVALVG